MEHDPTRRMLITALAGLTLANVSRHQQPPEMQMQGKSRILVAYFSRSGNTRVIAGVIHRSLNTDLLKSNRLRLIRKTISRPLNRRK
jgi:hypothetical protein